MEIAKDPTFYLQDDFKHLSSLNIYLRLYPLDVDSLNICNLDPWFTIQ